MDRELERIIATELGFDEAIADRMIDLDGITAFVDTRLPDVWDANHLRLERPGIELERILAAGDETIGAAGMRHRAITPFDEADGERLAAELGPRGWKVERSVYMVHRGPPDREGAFAVEEVTQDEVEAARREFLDANLAEWSRIDEVSEGMVDQFLRRDRLLGQVAGDRWFVVREEGEVLSFCRLLVGGGTAQIEDVATLRRARGRGFARSATLAAVRAARSDGHRLVWLAAIAAEWPRKLYARLGFELVGADVGLYLPPQRA